MKKTFLPWLAVVIGGVSLAAFAQAPVGTGIMTSSGAISSKTAQADSDYQAAREHCNTLSGAARTNCMNDARMAYNRATKAGNDSGSASSGTTGAGQSGSGTTGAGTSSSGTSGGSTGAGSSAAGGASGPSGSSDGTK